MLRNPPLRVVMGTHLAAQIATFWCNKQPTCTYLVHYPASKNWNLLLINGLGVCYGWHGFCEWMGQVF